MKVLFTAIVALVLVDTALAHFPFIVPSTAGSRIQVVFNDSLEPDRRVPIDRIASTRLFAIDANGKETSIKLVKERHALAADLPGKNFLVLGGFTDRGFVHSEHTDNKPVWVKHYPKAVIGDVALVTRVRLDAHVPLELVPMLIERQLRFQALWKGNPLPGIEVAVLVPNESKARITTTDGQGVTRNSFDQSGRYGARAGYIEQAVGELNGKKYEEIRSYATLVLDFSPVGH